MTPTLPIDILEEIFENLESLISTLYSCLLLSRSCCKAIIPILYRQPFRYTRRNPSPKLIRTYLSNITSKDISHIIKVDIDLLKKYNIELIKSSNYHGNYSIFNYYSHLKRLNYRDLYDFILIWYKNTQKQDNVKVNHDERFKFLNSIEDEPYSQEPMKTLSRILLNIFMSKGAKLDYLFMDSGKELINQTNSELNFNADEMEEDDFENFVEEIDDDDKYFQTPTISFPVLDNNENTFDYDCTLTTTDIIDPILKNFLENLKIFGFYGKGKFQDKSFDNISLVSTNIETLIINLTVNDEWNTERAKKEMTSLNNLINHQKNLKEFIFVEYQGRFWWSPSSRLRDVEIDFSHHVHNLLVLELYDVDFRLWKPLHGFTSLTNLQELAFISCRHQENVMAPLKYSSYKKLKKLSIIGWNGITLIDPKIVEILIENSKDSLKSLSIILTHEISTIVLESINKFQPDLLELALKFDQTHYIILQSLSFHDFENLEKLTLSNWGFVPIDVELILPLLGKCLPPNLKKLQILARWTFSIKALKEFLNNCEAKLKFIDIRHCTGITNEHIDLIWTKLNDSLERLIIRDSEDRRLNDEIPYAQVIETKGKNSFNGGEDKNNSDDISSSCNVSSDEGHKIYTKRIEIEPSEDEIYSYIRTEQLRYRWE